MAITFIVPSYNNLRYLKNAIRSIRTYAGKEHEIVVLDDASVDGTCAWLDALDDKNMIVWQNTSGKRLGHTITYNLGAYLATNEIISILHADMFIGPNYVENALKHLSSGCVVSATRIEPPLHPAGLEKITMNFGMWPEEFDEAKFLEFVAETQIGSKDNTTNGIFAPWFIHKEDFLAIGGHDPLFAPFPYEDSDIFQRFILAGYGIIQSRDSLVYHLTCRGHKWTDSAVLGKVDDSFEKAEIAARKNYLRKWGSWIRNDEFARPILLPKYNTAVIIRNAAASPTLLPTIEPYVDLVVLDLPQEQIEKYCEQEQLTTTFDMSQRVRWTEAYAYENADVLIHIKNADLLDLQDVQFLANHNEMISLMIDQADPRLECGVYEFGNLEIEILDFPEDMTPDLQVVDPEHRIYPSDIECSIQYKATGLTFGYSGEYSE